MVDPTMCYDKQKKYNKPDFLFLITCSLLDLLNFSHQLLPLITVSKVLPGPKSLAITFLGYLS